MFWSIKFEYKELFNKSFAFVLLSISSQKEVNLKNIESMPLWLNMRLRVDVCAFLKLKNKY